MMLKKALPVSAAIAFMMAACGGTEPAKDFGAEIDASIQGIGSEQTGGGCVHPGGWWKLHNRFATDPSYQLAWPIDENMSMCGNTLLWYLQNTPEKTNTWHYLMREVIASILNERSGAALPPDVKSQLYTAKLLVGTCRAIPAGSEGQVWSLIAYLEQYNNGQLGPAACQ